MSIPHIIFIFLIEAIFPTTFAACESRDFTERALLASASPASREGASCDEESLLLADFWDDDSQLFLLQTKADKRRSVTAKSEKGTPRHDQVSAAESKGAEPMPKAAEVRNPVHEGGRHPAAQPAVMGSIPIPITEDTAVKAQHPDSDHLRDVDYSAIEKVVVGSGLHSVLGRARLAVLIVGLATLLLGLRRAGVSRKGVAVVRQAGPEMAALWQAVAKKGGLGRALSRPDTAELFEDKLAATSPPWEGGGEEHRRLNSGEEKAAQLLAFLKDSVAHIPRASLERADSSHAEALARDMSDC